MTRRDPAQARQRRVSEFCGPEDLNNAMN